MELEYKTLRDEIGHLQNQAARILEVGLVLASSIFTISYSTVIQAESQWIVLLSPSFLLIPLVYLILDRVRTTWIIGRYIELFLEPRLKLHWEAYNRYLRRGTRKRFSTKFALGTIMPLIVIQMIAPVLSLTSGVSDVRLWSGLSVVAGVIIALELTLLRRFLITEEDVAAMKSAWMEFRKKKK
jgi:hypothetical protein